MGTWDEDATSVQLEAGSPASVSVTLKGTGEPWIVFRAPTLEEAEAMLKDSADSTFTATVAKASKLFQEKHRASVLPKREAAEPQPARKAVLAKKAAPKKAAPAAVSDGGNCHCGEPAEYTEFTSKSGNLVQAYKCAKAVADYTDPEACDYFVYAERDEG